MEHPTARLIDVLARSGMLRTLLVWLALVLLSPGLRAEGMAAAEKARVDGMISHLEGLKDAVFIRNGTEHDSKTAAKFLRGKWESNAGKIKTAEDFIRVAATKSSTTGKPYMIRLKGAKATPCADYLTDLLAKQKS